MEKPVPQRCSSFLCMCVSARVTRGRSDLLIFTLEPEPLQNSTATTGERPRNGQARSLRDAPSASSSHVAASDLKQPAPVNPMPPGNPKKP